MAAMSDAVIAPDAFTSNREFAAPAAWPDRAFTAETSPALIERESFTSPIRNPSEAEAFSPIPFTLVSVTVMRLLSVMTGSVTTISLPEGVAVAPANSVRPSSTTLSVPADATGPSNWNTIVCPVPMARGSMVTMPDGFCAVSMRRS
jgi:hypothetical protein